MGQEVWTSPLTLWLVLCLLVGVLLVSVGTLFMKSSGYSADCAESFDCGIDPLGPCRVPFALHFFLVAVVFVVFDAEMLLSLPLIFSPLTTIFWSLWSSFLALLFLGLVLEFLMRTIDWKE